MKRMITLAMCLVMLLCTAISLGETTEKAYLGKVATNGSFELLCTVPDGYTISQAETGTDSGNFLALIMSEDTEKPVMVLSVAFDEMYSDVPRLNELDDDALKQIEQTFRSEDEVEISYHETAHGTKLMMIKENRDSVDYVDYFTIYKGYMIEFVLMHGNEAKETLTEEQIQLAVTFLSNLNFVDVSADGNALHAAA
ncbi:MAG: hypothetical protein K6A68_15210 [Clostridiales bacterium]|nr:hypothetical protein [Clostridiales bacterium]